MCWCQQEPVVGCHLGQRLEAFGAQPTGEREGEGQGEFKVYLLDCFAMAAPTNKAGIPLQNGAIELLTPSPGQNVQEEYLAALC